jgi:ferredoxin
MDETTITKKNLAALVERLRGGGTAIVAPVAGEEAPRELAAGQEPLLEGAGRLHGISFKQFFFPRTEPLFHFRQKQGDVEIADAADDGRKALLLGVRPCDARAAAVLAKVFNWDFHDEFFNRRMARTTVVGMLCGLADDACFCTSVGSSPAATEGSDIFLVPLGGGEYAVRAVTKKGEELLAGAQDLLGPGRPEKSREAEKGVKEPPRRFDGDQVRAWIGANFEHAFWKEPGELCLACGRCAFVCPTCHCFDIVDEETGYGEGRRMKNWDACQFGLFTLHASGHNPRESQQKRYRQRVAHKFKYYRDRFGETLCTGCGRCTRGCPVGTDIGAVVEEIARLAAAAPR